MESPVQTITFLCGVIMCIIGVATFISALLARAKENGQLDHKVDEALRGISEIKSKLNQNYSWQENIGLKVQSHEEKILTLFNHYNSLDRRLEEIEK